MKKTDFSSVTEVTGYNVTKEQICRMYQRYKFAAKFCKDKEVLEVACGSGQGLGYIANQAKRVFGGDVDVNCLKYAIKHYKDKDNLGIGQIDALNLPFKPNSFDVVILYEALYYLNEPEKFIKEALRILKEGGVLIICTANKDLFDFNPSPYSYRYFSTIELNNLLSKAGFKKLEFYGGFKAENSFIKDKITSFIKKIVVKLNLMPKTMKGKEIFKRIFFGKLIPLPSEISDGLVEYIEPTKISHKVIDKIHKVIFVVAHK